jgi:hypothetical protein
MKKLILLNFLLITFSLWGHSQANKITPKMIIVEYSNEIHGYSIKAIWKPSTIIFNHIVGPAIIEFISKKDSASFTLTNNNFSIQKNRLPFSYTSEGLEIEKLNQKCIRLAYNQKNLKTNESFGTTNEPFFFQDIDFDNIKELIIVEVGNGQRGVASFKAYKFDVGGVQSDLYNITYKEPFKLLDEMSTVDYKNKRITIYGSNGVCAGTTEIYELHTAKNGGLENKFVLETIIEEQRYDSFDDCYEVKYKVISSTKQLISKKEIK